MNNPQSKQKPTRSSICIPRSGCSALLTRTQRLFLSGVEENAVVAVKKRIGNPSRRLVSRAAPQRETQESERQTREGRIQHHHLRAVLVVGLEKKAVRLGLFGSLLGFAWLFVVERSCPA